MLHFYPQDHILRLAYMTESRLKKLIVLYSKPDLPMTDFELPRLKELWVNIMIFFIDKKINFLFEILILEF